MYRGDQSGSAGSPETAQMIPVATSVISSRHHMADDVPPDYDAVVDSSAPTLIVPSDHDTTGVPFHKQTLLPSQRLAIQSPVYTMDDLAPHNFMVLAIAVLICCGFFHVPTLFCSLVAVSLSCRVGGTSTKLH